VTGEKPNLYVQSQQGDEEPGRLLPGQAGGHRSRLARSSPTCTRAPDARSTTWREGRERATLSMTRQDNEISTTLNAAILGRHRRKTLG